MDTPQLIATIMGAGGGGAMLLALINGLFKWLSGASHRERERNTDLATQRRDAIEARDAAEKERDEADKKRREAEEHVAILQRQLLLAGFWPQPRDPNTETPPGRPVRPNPEDYK